MSIRLALAVAAFLSPVGLTAAADTMTGQEMASFLPGTQRTFAAGSVAQFGADGSYSFNHGNSVESGSYTVTSADQLILEPVQGKRSVARIETTGNASYPYRMVYLRGAYRGQSFDFR